MTRTRALFLSISIVMAIFACGFLVKTFFFNPDTPQQDFAGPEQTSPTGTVGTRISPEFEPQETQTTSPPKINVPELYLPIFLQASERCPQVPLNIFIAQLHAESSFDPRAESPVGARGIAQFMPETWKAYAVDGNNDGDINVWDPEDAIHSAAEYNCALLNYIRKVPGDTIVNMLAAYNSGPGSVRKYKGIPPFPETETYVDKILRNAIIVDTP